MKAIHCNECNRYLFDTNRESDGAIGSEAKREGFIFKMPFLYTGKSGCLFFCSKECNNSYYGKHIPENPEVTAKLKKLREEIPERSKEIAEGIGRIMEAFKKKTKS